MGKYLGFCLVMAFAIFQIGCKTSTPVSPTGQQIGCSVETLVTTAAAGAIASADSCTNVSQIQSDIQGALGSINLCASATVQAQLVALQKKEGDKYKGIVGNIVCPLATDAVLSLIGSKTPASWGCSGSASVAAAISAACIAAVPI